MNQNTEENYMYRAIDLAKKGQGWTLPNPLVGAVIVKDDKIIGDGYHECFGGLHAERNAIAAASGDIKGADMYVTLEPCAHHGKTPPCTEAIIQSGIKRVFIGSSDPNPKVRGKGIEQLKVAGIEVVSGVLKDECDKINNIFFHYITTGLPYVMLKYAMSADGKIATKTGDSKWISSESSRQIVQEMRNEYPAIMVGLGTVIKDDPKLTCRMKGGMNPIRLICDSSLRIPLDVFVVQNAKITPTFVVCALPEIKEGLVLKAHISSACENKAAFLKRYCKCVSEEAQDINYDSIADKEIREKIKALSTLGVGIINSYSEDNEHTDLKELVKIFGDCGIAGIMLEGGSELNFSALETGIVNEVNVFIGSKMIGGNAKTPVGGEGVGTIAEAFPLGLTDCRVVGGDVLLKYITM